MKSIRFLLAAALCFTTAPLLAETEPPPAPPAPVGQTTLTPPASAPAPAPAPAPAATAPAPVARKEETDIKIRSGFFANLFPGGKNAISKEQAADEILRLRAENDDLRTQLAAAQDELEAIAEDWPAIREALLAGKTDAPVLQKPLGQQVVQATAAAAASAAANAGHDPAKLPGPKSAPSAATTTPDKPVTPATALQAHFAAKGWTQPGLT